ncbi:hypothetical protein C8R43DRAFT_558308 [Mycena crocata]|nr:hypothetical protein C8R43DRAFT_558308 [Mycena crocata]
MHLGRGAKTKGCRHKNVTPDIWCGCEFDRHVRLYVFFQVDRFPTFHLAQPQQRTSVSMNEAEGGGGISLPLSPFRFHLVLINSPSIHACIHPSCSPRIPIRVRSPSRQEGNPNPGMHGIVDRHGPRTRTTDHRRIQQKFPQCRLRSTQASLPAARDLADKYDFCKIGDRCIHTDPRKIAELGLHSFVLYQTYCCLTGKERTIDLAVMNNLQ